MAAYKRSREFTLSANSSRPRPKKITLAMTGLKCIADVARRRTRNEKIYKAGARRSVIIAAQNTDRRAAVSEIELALSTPSGRSRSREAAIAIHPVASCAGFRPTGSDG